MSNKRYLTRRFIRVMPPSVQCCEIDVCRGRSGAGPQFGRLPLTSRSSHVHRAASRWTGQSRDRDIRTASLHCYLGHLALCAGHQTAEIEMFCGATAALSACYIPIN